MKPEYKYFVFFILGVLGVYFLTPSKVVVINLTLSPSNMASKQDKFVTAPTAKPVVRVEPPCLRDNSYFYGQLVVNRTVPNSLEAIEEDLSYVNLGGWWKPEGCATSNSVAVIIPYHRNNKDNLFVLLRPLHKLLRLQELNYRVFLAEQRDALPLNKGKLLNAAFLHASKIGDYDCIVFQNPDYIPENDLNRYDCPNSPRLLSTFWEGFDYRPVEEEKSIGGVISISKKHLKHLNGWSNLRHRWGGENKDFYERIMKSGQKLHKAGAEGRYAHLIGRSVRRKGNRTNWLRKLKRWHFDWSTGLSDVQYNLIGSDAEKLFTHLIFF